MKKYLIVAAVLTALAAPASAQLTAQQQRMKDCNTKASGMTSDARKQFMSTCLSGGSAGATGRTALKANRAAIPVSQSTRSVISSPVSRDRPAFTTTP